jgi:hypothetical protein
VDIGLSGGVFKKINNIWSGYRVYPGSITSSLELNDRRRIEAEKNFIKIIKYFTNF